MNPCRILVPVDGSDCSLHALDLAMALAQQLNAAIVLGHVVDVAKAAMLTGGDAQFVEGSLDLLEAEGQRILDEATARAGPAVEVSSRIVQGSPVDAIDRLAADVDAFFIVIGSHGRTGLDRLVMGSVAEGVVRGARLPVMVVPTAYRPATVTASHAETTRSA